jgi:large subunit ribosomal protein L17
MRHRKKAKQFNMTSSHRRAMFNNLSRALVLNGSIQTTLQRAKQLKIYVEPMITRAKSGTVHDRRVVAAFLTDPVAVKKMFDEIGPFYKERNGGYTRILKYYNRKGDNAEIAIIELVDKEKLYKKEEVKAEEKGKKPVKVKKEKPAKEKAESAKPEKKEKKEKKEVKKEVKK